MAIDGIPIVPGGHFIAPLKRSTTFDTKIAQFEDGSEQRYTNRGDLSTFTLGLNRVSLADRMTMDAYVASKTGPYDTTWYLTFVPQVPEFARNYWNCAFEDDKVSWTERSEGMFDGTIRFRQTKTLGGLAPIPNIPALTDFPGFGQSAKCVTGFPYVSEDNYYVARVDLPAGVRSAYYFTGLPGFAARATKTWKLALTTLTNLELNLLESHFIAAGGRTSLFAYTDPKDGKRYARVRYATDSLDIEHVGYGINSVTVPLEEVFGPGWVA